MPLEGDELERDLRVVTRIDGSIAPIASLGRGDRSPEGDDPAFADPAAAPTASKTSSAVRIPPNVRAASTVGTTRLSR